MAFPDNKAVEIQYFGVNERMQGRVHLATEGSFLWWHWEKLGEETRNQGDGDKAGLIQVRWINVENRKRDAEGERISA